MDVESHHSFFKSLKKAKKVCSEKEKCTGIQIDECDETHKIRLCTSAIHEYITKSACVYEKGNKCFMKNIIQFFFENNVSYIDFTNIFISVPF